MGENHLEPFLASLSAKDRVPVSNLSPGVYLAVIMQKEANATAGARVVDAYVKQDSRLTRSFELLAGLSVAELQRLGMSVHAAQEGIKAYSAGNLPDARKHLEEACRHNPYNADAWCSLGVVIGNIGDHAEGVSTIKKALALDRDNRAARDSLAALGAPEEQRTPRKRWWRFWK